MRHVCESEIINLNGEKRVCIMLVAQWLTVRYDLRRQTASLGPIMNVWAHEPTARIEHAGTSVPACSAM